MKRIVHTMIAMLLFLVLLSLAPTSAVAEGLNILLTDHDRWDSTGIQTMKVALEAAGHNTVLIAPLTNQSAISVAITLGLVTVDQKSENEYAVDGTPATCVAIAIYGIMEEPPDLIVSGINNGANVGNATVVSGTVGAVITGILLGIPSIAFSTDPPTDDETDPAFKQHFVNVADFAVRLIAHLQTTPGSLHKSEFDDDDDDDDDDGDDDGGLLPPHLGLNVNYPPLSPDAVKGIQLCVQGRVSERNLIYIEYAPGLFIPAWGPPLPYEPDVKDSDTVAYNDGFVTIVPIDGDFTASRADRKSLKSVVVGLTP